MQTFDITVSKRTNLGKKETAKLRSEGIVPGIIYGQGEPIHIQASLSDYRLLIYTPNVYIVNITLEGKVIKAIIKDTQYHALTDVLQHIDFLEIVEDKKVKMSVPMRLVGFAKGVKEGGKLISTIRKFKIQALPKFLPDMLEVNVENLGVGESIKISSLNFENIDLLDPKTLVIATVQATRQTRQSGSEEKEKGGKKKK